MAVKCQYDPWFEDQLFFDQTEFTLDLKHQYFYNKRTLALLVTLGNLGALEYFQLKWQLMVEGCTENLLHGLKNCQ